MARASSHVVSPGPPGSKPELFHRIAEACPVAREGKPQFTSTFQASACVMFSLVPLSKASYIVKPQFQGWRNTLHLLREGELQNPPVLQRGVSKLKAVTAAVYCRGCWHLSYPSFPRKERACWPHPSLFGFSAISLELGDKGDRIILESILSVSQSANVTFFFFKAYFLIVFFHIVSG